MSRISRGVPARNFLPRLLCRTFVILITGLLFAGSVWGQDDPAVITNVKVEPSPFSPNGDGINEKTTFSFTLSEASTVTVEILFLSNPTVIGGVTVHSGPLNDSLILAEDTIPFASDTILHTTAGIAGVNQFVWNGTVNNGALLLPDSTYTYLIRVEDNDTDDSLKSLPVTGRLIIDKIPPVISLVSATPNPFSPNNDGINDFCQISFNLGGMTQNANVAKIGFNVTVVGDNAVFGLDNPPATTYNLWHPDSTVTVPYGPVPLEFVKRSANTEDIHFLIRGGRILDSGDTITVNTSQINILAADPVNTVYRDPARQKFSFLKEVVGATGGTGTIGEKNVVDIRTSVGGLKVDVRDSHNDPVTTLVLSPPFSGSGSYSASFGPNYPDDTYNYVIEASDLAGNLTVFTGTITARSNPINITGLVAEPDTISPADHNNEYDFSQISYSLTQAGRVTLQVFRDSTVFVTSNLVRTLKTGESQDAGGHSVLWDGKNEAGAYVSQGQERLYTFILSALDPLTFESSEARGKIYVDNRPPLEMVVNPLVSPTRSLQVTLSGRTDPQSVVSLYLDGAFLDSLVSAPISGNFSLAGVVLSEGLNLITGQAVDRVRNGPTLSDTVKVILDTRAPRVVDTLISVGGVRKRLYGGTLLTSFGPTDTIQVRISDGSGSVSGVALGKTTMQVTTPTGTNLQGTVLRNPPDTARFVPTVAATELGTYILRIGVEDSIANRDSVRVTFNIGLATSGPTLGAVVPDTAGFLNTAFAQPWQFSATVIDHSGTGINTQTSFLALYFAPAGGGYSFIQGTSSATAQGSLTFKASQAVATDGSMDGEYRLMVTADDNDPGSGTLVTTLSYFYDSQLPDILQVSADSIRVRVTLFDPSPGSGAWLLGSSMTVQPPAGVTLPQVSYTNDGDSTLLATFDSPLPDGIYQVSVTAADRAGNTRTRVVSFAVGLATTRPQIIQVSQPFGRAINAGALSQPLNVGFNLQDNSGTGIDWTKTTVSLVGPDSTVVPARTEHTSSGQNQYALLVILEKTLANDGTDDGRYALYAHVEDLSPTTLHLDTTLSFVYDNLPPDTTGISFAFDSSTVSVSLADNPSVAGRISSGLDILGATATVTDPGGATVPASVTHNGKNTITVRFTGGKPKTAGVYTARVTAYDQAANLLTLSFNFSLNVTARVVISPPDSSLVTGPLARVTALITGAAEGLAPGAGAVIRVSHAGLPVQGSSGLKGDTLIYVFNDTLAVDGTADGRYGVTAEMNLPALGNLSTVSSIFTVDNLPPDTASVEVFLEQAVTRVRATFTDRGLYPEVSGINPAATNITLENPTGQQVTLIDTSWVDEVTLEAEFEALSVVGQHRLRLAVADRAGHSVTRLVNLVSSSGTTGGPSISFVEDQDIPARTRARVHFVSGRAESRIVQATLRIFNLRGDLIRKLDVSDRIEASGSSVSAEWLLENDSGSQVINGVFIYYWEITFDNGRKERLKKTLAVARK